MLKNHDFDIDGLDYKEFVIATENGNPIGCGRLKKIDETYEIGCIIVAERHKGRGISSFIITHLIEYTPLNVVYAVTDKVDYYKKLGFVEVQDKVKELEESLVRACKTSKKKAIIMAYEK
ncbi:MAG: GNAT family N-acetyltransferase [Nitrospirae bacterium]|nr:GNAT family N-acetyltransferase [Nitrospirota bacterium]